MDHGEVPLEAAARELREGTGVWVPTHTLTMLGVWDAPGQDPRGRYSTTAYVVQVPADTAATAGDDAAEVRWLPIADATGLAFDHDEIVGAALGSGP